MYALYVFAAALVAIVVFAVCRWRQRQQRSAYGATAPRPLPYAELPPEPKVYAAYRGRGNEFRKVQLYAASYRKAGHPRLV